MGQDFDPDSLSSFIDRKEQLNWSAQVVNRTEPKPIEGLVRDLFAGLGIETSDANLDGVDDDLLLLVRDGKVVESASIETVKETLLLVNSDLYTTGAKSIDEIEIPDIVTKLSDTVFTLEGYPRSNTEKLVLTLVSRYIEHLAWRNGAGVLRTSFQRLSRLDDERGTREVYERLGQTPGLETHVYGIADSTPPPELGLTVHPVTDDEITNHWFVVYRAEDARSAAMVARKVDSCTWNGYWTFDDDDIRAIERYVTRTF